MYIIVPEINMKLLNNNILTIKNAIKSDSLSIFINNGPYTNANNIIPSIELLYIPSYRNRVNNVKIRILNFISKSSRYIITISL